MAVLKESRYSQPVQSIEFEFNFDDTMLNTSGVSKDFGLTNTAATIMEVIKLPVGAVLVGGELAVETAFDTASWTVTVGDSVTADRYHASADRKAAARTALTITGYKVLAATQDIRMAFTNADACTTGKAILRVQFVQPGNAREVTGSP